MHEIIIRNSSFIVFMIIILVRTAHIKYARSSFSLKYNKMSDKGKYDSQKINRCGYIWVALVVIGLSTVIILEYIYQKNYSTFIYSFMIFMTILIFFIQDTIVFLDVFCKNK